MALWESGDGKWYPATIASLNGGDSYTVHFDDDPAEELEILKGHQIEEDWVAGEECLADWEGVNCAATIVSVNEDNTYTVQYEDDDDGDVTIVKYEDLAEYYNVGEDCEGEWEGVWSAATVVGYEESGYSLHFHSDPADEITLRPWHCVK